jgi:hypothetical protein
MTPTGLFLCAARAVAAGISEGCLQSCLDTTQCIAPKVLTLAVVNDPTVGVAGIEDVLDPLLVLYILQLSNSGISSLSSDSLSPPLS